MKILAVSPHPDDLEIVCAGTLAKYKRLGHDVNMAFVTNGEVGSPTLSKIEIAAIREDESRKSASIINAGFYWLGYPDEFLFNNVETRLRFIELVRNARPDLIICSNPQSDYHPDHTTSGQIIWDIRLMTTVPNIKTETPPCDVIPQIVYMDTIGGGNFLPNRYVDITEDFETKKKMLSCHKSQDIWIRDQYDIPLVEMMETFSRTRGFQCGCKFAEAFYVPVIHPAKVETSGLL
jgi:LmbE family N-acetylglucosaminyl deacetylase